METKTSLNIAKTSLEKAINEVFDIMGNLTEDNQTLKFKAYQPSPVEAKIFLDYFSWEDGNPKQNFEALYKKELQILQEWLHLYCGEQNCTKEEALSRIIDGAI